MPVGTGSIAAADRDPVQEGMIVVAQNRDYPVSPGKIMDLFQRLFRATPPVDEISEIHDNVNRAKRIAKFRGPYAGHQGFKRGSICMHIGKNDCTHTVSETIGSSF